MDVDGYETRSTPECIKAVDSKLLSAVPTDAFVHSFFVNDWNFSFTWPRTIAGWNGPATLLPIEDRANIFAPVRL